MLTAPCAMRPEVSRLLLPICDLVPAVHVLAGGASPKGRASNFFPTAVHRCLAVLRAIALRVWTLADRHRLPEMRRGLKTHNSLLIALELVF
jgi:hypothetical protein